MSATSTKDAEVRYTDLGAAQPALFSERPADDGWPEDAGLWPIDACIPATPECSYERGKEERQLSIFQFVKSWLRNGNRT